MREGREKNEGRKNRIFKGEAEEEMEITEKGGERKKMALGG